MAICHDDSISIGGSNRVQCRESEWISVNSSGERGVSGLESELVGDDLLPESTGDGVAEGAADVVGCEVDAGHDGHIWWRLVCA